MTFHDITFPEDQQACVSSNEQLAAGELQNYQREKRFIRRDGSAVWTRVAVSAVRQPGGDLAFFVPCAETSIRQAIRTAQQ